MTKAMKVKEARKSPAKKVAAKRTEPLKRTLQWGMCPHTPGNYCDYCLGGA
jgi:hypothetical protein